MLDNAPDLAEIVAQVRTRFGDRGLAGLAAAIHDGQFYPMLKRATGHAVTCEPVLRDLLAESGG